MQPDQQQRILGYFLEEAREHLNTIEQGLLNLQITLDDTEMMQEVFRAAHSIKGGASMLGLSGIQHTSHRLEDCFKILKDYPIQVDQTLESLLLAICDTLKALIEDLGNPFGVSEKTTQELMSKTEPIIQTLHDHIQALLGRGNLEEVISNTPSIYPPVQIPVAATIRQTQDWTGFQTQVSQILREMLQLFKQTSLSSSRESLHKCCDQLATIGKDLKLSHWCKLCESANQAISNPDNSYLTLAKIIITEIKQAQELVLQNRDSEITVSQQLENLLPLPELKLLEFNEPEEPKSDISSPATREGNFTHTNGLKQLLSNDSQSIIITGNALDYNADHTGLEVGIFELNTLADLFEGDLSDLDNNWEQEEILEDISSYQLRITDNAVEDNHQDLADLLPSEDKLITEANHEADLSLLFNENLLEIDSDNTSNQTDNDQDQLLEFSLANETDLQFPEDHVLEELIAICREARQNSLVDERDNTDSWQELWSFTEDNELSWDGEVSIPEITTQSHKDANSLLAIEEEKNEAVQSPGQIYIETVKTPDIKPSAPESLSVDNLFAQTEENMPAFRNEIDDLFGTLETIENRSSDLDNLDNFWDDLNLLDPGLDITANQDVAKELEESLFSASFQGVSSNPTTNNNSLDADFNLIFQEAAKSFTSDSSGEEIDIFGDTAGLNSPVAGVDNREFSLPVVNEFSQAPEAFDPIPEFIRQSVEITGNLEVLASDDHLSLLREEIKFPVGDVESESELETGVEVSLLDTFGSVEFPLDDFSNIEAPLNEFSEDNTHQIVIEDEDFAALEALLRENENNALLEIGTTQPVTSEPAVDNAANTFSPSRPKDEFSGLEDLLAQADQSISGKYKISQKTTTSKIPRPSGSLRRMREETMKVPIKQLDEMSNLVGELVVNRNSLERDHERLRQSLDNLQAQVQHLSDVGVRMHEYYERSLLEASLLAGRHTKEHNRRGDDSYSRREFSEIEMDRFTPFHILAQEMIEFIVRIRESASDIDFVTEKTEQVGGQLRQATSQLQERLTKTRMVPFTQAIDRLRRGVRDNAIKYGKQVELVTEGADTLVDKMILDSLTDPLTHMVNNAIAHGIETPDARQAAGKSPMGTITIRTLRQGNQTVIFVNDDGAGIDYQQVKTKAVQKGILTPEQAKTMSRLETYELLFLPNFSTADEVDDIRGRGVGMNVVRNDIGEIRGTVTTDSTPGKGTTFTIRLPLTLSICKALFCISDRAKIAFPMDGVEDTLNIPAKNVQKDAHGESFIPWRDIVLPFKPLKEILVLNRQLSRSNIYTANQDNDMLSVIVVRSANTMIALQIDQVLSEQEIVIKQFEGPAPKPDGIAGATVLGDGIIMPIADVIEIIDIFQGKMSKHIDRSWQKSGSPFDVAVCDHVETTVLIVDDSITVRELLSLTFSKAGYRVEQAHDGQEAWDKLHSGLLCDIVFCDIEMPRCDGLEFLSRVQKDSNLNNLPIAMLTSRGADKHRQMAIQLGASGYFTKPYLEEALLEAASRMLKGEKLAIA
ncbi:MAG: response regulator [Cuspidothrix sp.]